MIICTVFTALGSFLFKVGMDRFAWTPEGILAAYPVVIGGISYFLGFLFLIVALRHGELSVLYPITSLGFLWVTLLSVYMLSEKVGVGLVVGVVCVMVGVAFIGMASRDHSKGKLRLRN